MAYFKDGRELNERKPMDRIRAAVYYKLRRKFNKKQVDIIFTAISEEIANAIVEGYEVELYGLGKFYNKLEKERLRSVPSSPGSSIMKEFICPEHRIAAWQWYKGSRNEIRNRIDEFDLEYKLVEETEEEDD